MKRFFAFTKQKLRYKSNNRGSALIMVIVCTSFIGVLGLAMMMSAYMNYQMKLVDRQSKENFYDAEAVLNQTCAGLQIEAEKALDSAVEYAQKYYAATPQQERTDLLNRKFDEYFFGILAKNAAFNEISPGSGRYDTLNDLNKNESFLRVTANVETGNEKSKEQSFCEYLEKLTLEGSSQSEAELATNGIVFQHDESGEKNNIVIAYNIKDHYVEIQNLCVEYTDSKGFQTRITTDLRFEPPISGAEDYFTVSQVTDNMIIDDYAIIADGQVEGRTSSDAKVSGNVYGGNGIIASNSSKLGICGDYIVSRGDLSAVGNGSIEITKRADSSVDDAQVWVRNILSVPNKGVDSNEVKNKLNLEDTNEKNIDIVGRCYVSDDLILNNPGYDVSIDGSYYGYHTGNILESADDPHDGSAIAVNASDSNLNISGALWLAGKNMLDNRAYTAGGQSESVRQGESLSYKFAQDAYLLPGECIVGAEGQNPMPADLFEKLTENRSKKLELDFMKYPFITQINIEEYLDNVHPYTYKYVQQYTANGAENVVYIYLNFLNDSASSQYFARYASYLTQRLSLTAAANILGYGKVQLDEDVLNGKSGIFAGNLLLFDRNGMTDPDAGNPSGGTISPPKNDYSGNEVDEEADSDPFRDSVADTSAVSNESGSGNTEGEDSSSDAPEVTTSYSPYGSLTLVEKNRASYDNDIIDGEIELMYQYNGLISVLDKSKYSSRPGFNLVSNLLQSKGFTAEDMNVLFYPLSEQNESNEETMNYERKEITAVNGKIILDGSSGLEKGILIADKDVWVTGKFNGTIITTGNVMLDGNSEIQSAYTVGFNNMALALQPGELMERVKMSFRNWKKNS